MAWLAAAAPPAFNSSPNCPSSTSLRAADSPASLSLKSGEIKQEAGQRSFPCQSPNRLSLNRLFVAPEDGDEATCVLFEQAEADAGTVVGQTAARGVLQYGMLVVVAGEPSGTYEKLPILCYLLG